MSSPSTPTRIVPFNKQLLTAPESTAAGTAGTVFTREPVRSLQTTIVRTTETHTEYAGVAAAHVGEDEMYRHAQTDMEVACRVGGWGGQGLMTMLGMAADTVSGSGPYTHTGVPNAVTTSCNTYTLLHDEGDRNSSGVAQNLEQILFGTLNTYGLRFQPNGVVIAALQFLGIAPSPVAVPTITTYVGSSTGYPGTRINPSVCTFNIYNSAGALYTAKITQGTFNLARNVSPEFALGSKDPYDLVPQELMVSGGFTATFDGNGSGALRKDYVDFKELGDATHIHNILMAIDANNSIQLNFYPIRITGGSIDNSGRVKIQCTFNSYNDMGVLNAATPAITTLKSAVIKNAIATVMVS